MNHTTCYSLYSLSVYYGTNNEYRSQSDYRIRDITLIENHNYHIRIQYQRTFYLVGSENLRSYSKIKSYRYHETWN